MSNYHRLLTVKFSGGDLAIAEITDRAPDPGDLVELEDGTIATVVTRALFTQGDAEYQAVTAIVQPLKVTCWYERNPVKEAGEDVPC